jgi:hypothetical protein
MSYAIESLKVRLEYVRATINQMIDLEADKRTPKNTLMHIRRTMDGYIAEEKKLNQEIALIEKLEG